MFFYLILSTKLHEGGLNFYIFQNKLSELNTFRFTKLIN